MIDRRQWICVKETRTRHSAKKSEEGFDVDWKSGSCNVEYGLAGNSMVVVCFLVLLAEFNYGVAFASAEESDPNFDERIEVRDLFNRDQLD